MHGGAVIAFAAAAVATIAEAASNALFAYSLGGLMPVTIGERTISADGALLAAASAAISAIQARSATLAVRGPNRVGPAAVMVLCLCYSAGALTSHVLKLQRLQADERGKVSRSYDSKASARDRAAAELAALEAELAPLAAQRSEPEVRAAMDAAPVPAAVFRRSNQCTEVTQDDTRQACQPILTLRVEMARAIRAGELRRDLPGKRVALTAAEAALAGEQKPAEPGAAEQFAAAVLPWVFSVVLIVCATFGWALALAPVAPPKAPDAPRRHDPSPLPPDAAGVMQVLASVAAGSGPPGLSLGGDGSVRFAQRAASAAFGMPQRKLASTLSMLAAAGKVAVASGPRGTEVRVLQ